MPGSELLKETLNMYSEISLIYVVNACKLLVQEGVPNDLEKLMDRVNKLKTLGELINRALDAMYAAEDLDMRDFGDLEEGL